METAQGRLVPFGARVRFVNAWFGSFLASFKAPEIAALVLMDLGISRFHYEAGGRGFSFDRDEPLDMRLDPQLPTSAADIVNTWDAADIAEILFKFGEERFARQIATRIVREREKATIHNAARLAAIVAGAVPAAQQHRRLHPATKTFQALRIVVNHELDQLQDALAQVPRILSPGGRIGVISFHSLEDRIVKRYFREKSRELYVPAGMADLSMWGESGAAARHREGRGRLGRGDFPQPGQPQRPPPCRGEAAGERRRSGRMKRILTALLCLAIPGLLLLNAWEGYRYNALTDDVAALEDRQNALLETNRDLIGQIAFESSPAQVSLRAAALGLVPAADAATTRLLVDASGKAGTSR